MQDINIIVHAPKTAENQQELAKRVATVHADLVMQKLSRLSCPKEQKSKAFKKIKESCYER